ncbi:MAG: alanine racemase [Oscillospiraceae bacterium]
MKKLVIDKKALQSNIKVLKEKAGSAVLYGVLTGDGQGVGLLELAAVLRDNGVTRFVVSEPEQVAALRKGGFETEEILVVRSITSPEELELLIDLGAVCTIGSTEAGMALNALAETRSTVVEAHLRVDTGMGWGGFLPEEPDKLCACYRSLPNVAVSGIYTELRSSSEKIVQVQLDAFRTALDAIHKAGFETGCVHAAGSYALLHFGVDCMDAARIGSALLGRCQREKHDGLTRIGFGEVPIEDIRWLPRGKTIGSDHVTTLRKAARVAVLPIGYQNGFALSHRQPQGVLAAIAQWWRTRKRTVTIGGEKARVIGHVGAIETVIDITNLKCATGDLALFDIDPLFAKGLTLEYR